MGGGPGEDAAREAAPGSSLERTIGILDLFDGSAQRWTVDEMHVRLGYSRSTLYRYLKVLTDAGLLTSLPDLGYTLGPRIIELDHQIRTQDPLILASRPVMAALAAEVGGIALLCRRYHNKVLCVHQEIGTESFRSTYERGRARPLLKGAASRIILAYLPPQKIGQLFSAQPEAFAEAELGETIQEVRATLKAMRQRGWDATTGQVTLGVTGVAAPLFDKDQNILGSLSLTMAEADARPERIADLGRRLTGCTRGITQALTGPKTK
jgi:DNA-binding IclR family transcriptional regulator